MLIQNSMLKSWSICMNVCNIYDTNYGWRISGCCIRTMHLCTSNSLCMSFWLNKIATMDQPPYSSNLVLCDFCLFCKVENIMQGENFVDVDTTKQETTTFLKGLIKKEMQDWFQDPVHCVRWRVMWGRLHPHSKIIYLDFWWTEFKNFLKIPHIFNSKMQCMQ